MGAVHGETQAVEVAVGQEGEAPEEALAPVWARMKIAELWDRLALRPRARWLLERRRKQVRGRQ